jgi:hypothetical protein
MGGDDVISCVHSIPIGKRVDRPQNVATERQRIRGAVPRELLKRAIEFVDYCV